MKDPKTHRRTVFTADARFTVTKAAEGDAKIATLTGYAIVWNALSSDRGGFKVRLLPGSARFTNLTHALWHHDFAMPLGDTVSGTLRIMPDDVGVKVEIDLPDTQAGRDAEELVETRRVRGMSFAMVTAPEASAVEENGEKVLNVTGFDCDEVTITAIPAFAETTIDVKEDEEPEEDAAEPAVPLAASARTAQSLRLQKLKFEFLTLPGAEIPGRLSH